METVMLLRVPEPETGVLNLTSGPDRSRLSPLVVIVTESRWVPKSAMRESKSEYPTID